MRAKSRAPLGELRLHPVRCAAVVGSSRCRAFTRNPNCFCGVHQHLTRLPRFEWVYSAESVISKDRFRCLTAEERELVLIEIAIKEHVLAQLINERLDYEST